MSFAPLVVRPQQTKLPYHISSRIEIVMRTFALIALLLLTGCGPSGPTEADMAGCAVRSGGPSITYREVADCAVDRAETEHRREAEQRSRDDHFGG